MSDNNVLWEFTTKKFANHIFELHRKLNKTNIHNMGVLFGEYHMNCKIRDDKVQRIHFEAIPNNMSKLQSEDW